MKSIWKMRFLALVAALLVAASLCLTSCGDSSDDPTQETTTTTAVTTTTKATTTTTKATTTTTKATTTTTTAPTASTTRPSMSTIPPTQATTSAPTQPTENNDEILGEGSQSQPYLETPTENMTVTTAQIPAGSSRFYDIYRVGGMILTIYDGNAYVVCDGVRYDANGGAVSFTVPSALASDAVSFEIGNSGSYATSFTLQFSNQKGSYMDPVVVSTLEDNKSVSLEKDADSGYYFKYIASQSGTIRLYMTASVDSVMLATNNRNSAQRTTEADAKTDAKGTYIELEVQAGDEILINVGAKPNKRGKYPAADITWFGCYA